MHKNTLTVFLKKIRKIFECFRETMHTVAIWTMKIYISRKIRLCVFGLEDKFQTNLQAKLINFLVWIFRSNILMFLLFFAEFVKSSFQRVDIFELQFLHRMALKFVLQINYTQTNFSWNVNVQVATIYKPSWNLEIYSCKVNGPKNSCREESNG